MNNTPFAQAILITGLALAASARSAAQPQIPVACCRISAIDVSGQVVTAKPMQAGSSFRFKFDSGALPSTLKLDQLVWARGGKVSLNGTSNCCTIIPTSSSGRGLLGLAGSRTAATSYSSESTAHARECDEVALRGSPRGGQKCNPKSTMISSGKNPDGSDATYTWTCVCG